jgi:ribosomal protein S18 acetylase RimI-like enzyme
VSTVELQRADVSCCEAVLQMQKEAFAALLETYQDYEINPANETAEQVMQRLMQPETYYYFITVNGERVGAIRIVDAKNGSCKRISPLFILPQYRNRGYAQAAIREAEQRHGVSNWSLSTIMQETGNCHLYEKMGYHRTGEPQKINERMTIVQYEKDHPELLIREIGIADIPACVQVIRRSFQTVADAFGFTAENAPYFTAFATDEAKMLYWMQEQHRPMYGSFADGKPVGCYNLLLGADAECELGSLCVLPEYRHCGIGGQLLNDALKRAAGLDCRIMKLSIVEENTVLRQWYEGFGFVHTGTKKYDFFPFTCGYLEKPIRQPDSDD